MDKSKGREEIVIGDIKTSFLKEGDPDKNLVLYVHGWGGTKETWQPFLEPIGHKRFFSVAIDLPGFGESDNPGSWGVREYSEFLEQFILKMGKGKASLIGRSFGGRIVAYLAAENSELVDRLVLVSAAGIPDDSIKTRIKKGIAQTSKKAFALPGLKNFSDDARDFLYRAYGVVDYIDADENKKQVFKKTASFNVEPSLRKIKAPTLIVWGENDKETPVENAYRMNGLIKNSKLVVVPNASHQVQATQKDRFISEVSSFL